MKFLDMLRATLSKFNCVMIYTSKQVRGIFKLKYLPFIFTKKEFISLIDLEQSILEIGPLNLPLVTGPRVKYFDVLNREELIKKAVEWGHSDISAQNVPEINYVSPVGDLGVINEKFDCVVSSHVIEHQPDLIHHLLMVDKLLNKGGQYFLIIPDKRYCFDYFKTPSTIIDVITAHHEKRVIHSFYNLIGSCFQAHNSSWKHYLGFHGEMIKDETIGLIKDKRELLNQSHLEYIDVHAWFFTPQVFGQIINDLVQLKLINFRIAKIYHTTPGKHEFFVILEK